MGLGISTVPIGDIRVGVREMVGVPIASANLSSPEDELNEIMYKNPCYCGT